MPQTSPSDSLVLQQVRRNRIVLSSIVLTGQVIHNHEKVILLAPSNGPHDEEQQVHYQAGISIY